MATRVSTADVREQLGVTGRVSVIDPAGAGPAWLDAVRAETGRDVEVVGVEGEATGEVIVVLDPERTVAPEVLARAAEVLLEDRCCGAVEAAGAFRRCAYRFVRVDDEHDTRALIERVRALGWRIR